MVLKRVIELQLFLQSFFFESRRRHTISKRDWSSDVCSSDLLLTVTLAVVLASGNPMASTTARVTVSRVVRPVTPSSGAITRAPIAGTARLSRIQVTRVGAQIGRASRREEVGNTEGGRRIETK